MLILSRKKLEALIGLNLMRLRKMHKAREIQTPEIS